MRSIAWILTSCSVLACAGCSTRLDPTALVQRYAELHGSGDVDQLLALHAADAEFVIPGQEAVRGSAALRDLFEWDAVLGSRLVMDGITAHGDTVMIGSVVERNRWFQAIGIAEARFKPGTRLVLRNGRIVGTYPAAFDDQTQVRLTEQFQRVVAWLSAERPGALEELLPGGKFRYAAESARLWLEILEEWNRAKREGLL